MIESNAESVSQSTATEAIMECPVLESVEPVAVFRCEAVEIDMLHVQNQYPVSMKSNNWPFDWSSVNLTGPTGLTELFRGLEIDCATPATQTTSDAQNLEEPMYISNSEFQNLWNPSNHSRASGMDDMFESPKKRPARSVPQHLKGSLQKVPSVSINYIGSPYKELYAFPSSHKLATKRSATPGLSLCAELEAQELDLQSKLRVLKKQSLPVYHPGIIATMEELANVYFNEAKFTKAEILYRQVVSARLKAPGTPPLKMLASCLNVVGALLNENQYRQAQNLLPKIMGALQKLVNPEHELAVKALYISGVIEMGLEDYELAEHSLSQVLQIQLSKFGPRHLESCTSIRNLGSLYIRTGRITESEKLLRTSLQLLDEV